VPRWVLSGLEIPWLNDITVISSWCATWHLLPMDAWVLQPDEIKTLPLAGDAHVSVESHGLHSL
jgi:hypothetical protein